MNLGYGIKHYTLKEEAAIPSRGYNDAVQKMTKKWYQNYLPWAQQGKTIKVRSRAELSRMILGKESVKKELALVVKKKLDYYKGTLHINKDEDSVYREVEKQAIKDIDIMASNYSHSALRMMAVIMRGIFTTIYDKIVVNESTLKKVRELCN